MVKRGLPQVPINLENLTIGIGEPRREIRTELEWPVGISAIVRAASRQRSEETREGRQVWREDFVCPRVDGIESLTLLGSLPW